MSIPRIEEDMMKFTILGVLQRPKARQRNRRLPHRQAAADQLLRDWHQEDSRRHL